MTTGSWVNAPGLGATQVAYLLNDYVVSGCVWSGDSYGASLNASMTSGIVCIGGNFMFVSAVTARAFTASKDTYVDITSAGVLVYTEATNNAASSALAAGSMRIAIIVSGAGSIAAAGSVNQGQETKVLPIASSVPYQVVDSLGNLICPRDPNRKILGYRQITSNFASGGGSTQTLVTGLTLPIIIPTGRKIRLTAHASALYSSAASYIIYGIWDGTVGSGTEVVTAQPYTAGVTYSVPGRAEVILTPTATTKTYNVSISSNAGNPTVAAGTGAAAAQGPAYIQAELV